MDYLCELPNDSSRRKALGNLPPTLPATYERILRSVNARPKETQLLVSRTLRWIVHSRRKYMSIEALCEAVSINIGDTERDKDSIPDELEILRWCSSLVRKGVGRDCLELAHFTVKGFLLQLDDNDTGEFSAYRIGPSHDENELAMVCLIYLNFRDFDQGIQGVYMDMAVTERRFKDYPLRRYAVYHWHDLARPRLADHELFSLAKQLLNPTKTGTLLSMLQDWTILWIANSTHIYGQWWLDQVKRAIAEATTLHFAAMFSLPEVCTWLTDSGDCDINRVSGFGTPLHCSLMTLGAIELFRNEDWLDPWEESWGMEEQDRVLEILLAAGADPNYYQGTLSPLFVSLKLFNYDTASQLIDKGARLDERCLKLLESFIDKIGDNDFIDEEIKGVMDRIQCQTVDAKNYSRILKVAKKFRSSGTATGVPGINKAKQFTKSGFESILRAAAEFGQMEVINQIIGGQSVDLGAAEEETGLTALHYAAMNDHLNVVKLLLSRGANPYEADCEGRNAIHHAIHSVGVQCLEHFLESISIDILLDVQGLSLWHWAATNQTKQALVILAKYSTPMPSLGSMRTKDGWSPLLSAASVGSAENIDWLLRAGCTTMDKAYDGSTALHLAARSGFSDAVRVLLRNGSEVSAVTDDGSTVLHFALLDLKEGISPVLKLLIEQGLDVSHAREDGVMPIHLLISHCANMTLPNENDDHGDLNGQPQSLFVWEKRWLLDAFGILARVTDFARKNCAGKSTLHLLADMWEKSDSTLSTTMMNIAMDKVLLTEVPQSLCIDPSYTIKALIIRDEELAYKFLKFFPDVDAVAGDSSIIKAACLNGCSSILLQELLSRSKIQSENKQFSGLVRAACRARPTESRHKVMEVLMNAGLSPNDSCPSSGETPLMIAACQGDTKVLEVLLSSGADIHALNRDGCNVTHFACMGGFLGILQILQKITIDWSRRGSGWIADEFSTGLSPLHLAAIHESSHALEFLLDENLVTDIDVVTDRSFTALSLAGLRARPQNVSLLLSRDADPAIRSFYGETPLQIAIRSGNEAVIREFLQYNRDLDFRGLDYGILLAKKYCHSSAEKMLKEYKEEQGKHLHPVLPKQLLTYWMLTVEVILSGRQPNPASRTGIDSFSTSRMLQDAIDLADIELCRRLIDEGASLSIGFDGCGCSPLLYLLLQSPLGKDKIEIAEFLVLQGASIEGVAGHRWPANWYTVFHFAAEFGYTRLLQILLDKYPSSLFELEIIIHPLHIAVLSRHYECVQLIVHHCRREHGKKRFPSAMNHADRPNSIQCFELFCGSDFSSRFDRLTNSQSATPIMS